MDLENLTKHQIVLLTLLVSFVTSIATGIFTVALMNQAPPSVTRTINQIVERTVQTVSPTTQTVAAVTAQKTVVVTDDDLVAQTIESIQKSIIRITARGSNELLARGVIINATGTALTDKTSLANAGTKEFDAILWNDVRVPLAPVGVQATSSRLLTVRLTATSTQFIPAPLVDSSKIRLGQSVIRLSGKNVPTVSQGVVASLPLGDMLEASVEATLPGSILITPFGEVLGMTTTQSLLSLRASTP